MALNIPIRTSSLAEWSKRRVEIRQSQSDLKRKMSQISIEKSPIAYQKLKIEHLESLEIEQMHQKEFHDIEHEARRLNDNTYRTAHRETNKRIISLGEELWQANQGLRSLEEQAGKRPALGADSHGAFAAVLLKLYKDPMEKSTKRSTSEQTKFRREAIVKYQSDKDAPKSYLFCPITNVAYDPKHVKAAHIVPSHLGVEIVEYLFGPGGGSRLYSADNCLIMNDILERHFDKGHFVLLPVDVDESPITRWKVQITNDDARFALIDGKPLKDLQGRELVFKNTARPASRFLYYHFVITLLRNAQYKTGNYEHYSKALPTGKPFATMGPYLRRSMLYALARKAGDVNTTFQDLIENAKETTFDASHNLDDKEEDEIARRVLQVEDDGAESDDDDDEEEEDEGED